jgi:serine O-acetyltransferase
VRGLLATGVKSHADFASALAALLGRKLGDRSVAADALGELVQEGFEADPDIVCAAAADLLAIRERDPACPDFVTPFLFFKGYHAVQTYRVAHWLWRAGRVHLALHLQSRASELFGVDIHPAARLGRRILFDHGTGIVVGETCVIENDVSILQNVTLGGTGKHSGDRHPKVRRGGAHRGRRQGAGQYRTGRRGPKSARVLSCWNLCRLLRQWWAIRLEKSVRVMSAVCPR